jgi:hypothetical protein
VAQMVALLSDLGNTPWTLPQKEVPFVKERRFFLIFDRATVVMPPRWQTERP